MIYLANFSYTDQSNENDNTCLFPCVVAASTPEEALDRFYEYLTKLHETALADVDQIYLESMTEIEEVSSEPVALQWNQFISTSEGLLSVASAFPALEDDEDNVAVYGWFDEDEEDACGCGEDQCDCDEDSCECPHDDEEVLEDVAVEPFIVFDAE